MEGYKNIFVKKLDKDAVIPKKANDTDAGFDIVAIDDGTPVFDENGILLYIEYRTGLSVEPPMGYHLEAFPRSSISKYNLLLANSIGLIDNGYRGEVKLRFRIIKESNNAELPKLEYKDDKFYYIGYFDIGGFQCGLSKDDVLNLITERNFCGYNIYKKGDKIAQLVIRKDEINFVMIEVDELKETKRGSGGFGSTG